MREELCRGKESAEEWLEVHRTWHQMGGRSTCTMLYGHIETFEQRVDHLRQLRELQDETGGFTGFIPFAFEPEKHRLFPHQRATAFDQLRNLAVSRIYLDNIDHLTAYWVSMGLPLAQVALSYGVDDLHGTIIEKRFSTWRGRRLRKSRPPLPYATLFARLAVSRCNGTVITITSGRRSPASRTRPHGPPANWSAPEVQAGDSLRLGCVRYLNALPLIDGWLGEVRFDHPSTLCGELAAGQLDVALVSSFEYLRNPVYSVVDGLAIASHGPVYSVVLAHLDAVEALREVVVDPASATSVNLLHCLLGEREVPARCRFRR